MVPAPQPTSRIVRLRSGGVRIADPRKTCGHVGGQASERLGVVTESPRRIFGSAVEMERAVWRGRHSPIHRGDFTTQPQDVEIHRARETHETSFAAPWMHLSLVAPCDQRLWKRLGESPGTPPGFFRGFD